MNSTWPGRSLAHSAGCGSFTFTIMSAAGEHLGGVGDDSRAGGAIVLVGEADAGAGAGLDQHLVAVRDAFADRAGGQADPVFVDLYFLGNADEHAGFLPVALGMWGAGQRRSTGRKMNTTAATRQPMAAR